MKKNESKDHWKEMIQENLEELNQREPRDLWEGIEIELDSSKVKQNTIELWKFYRIAAILVIVVGVLFFAIGRMSHSEESATANVKAISINPKYAELNEAEAYYTAAIGEGIEELKNIPDGKLAIEEVNLLKEEFDKLKSEMGDHVNDDRIIEAMIQNYRLRLELLESVLTQLNPQTHNKKEKKNEVSI